MGLRAGGHNEGALCPAKGELPVPSGRCILAKARASV